MSNKDGPVPHIEVDDPTVALRRAAELGRRVLAVPKKSVEKIGTTKKKQKRH